VGVPPSFEGTLGAVPDSKITRKWLEGVAGPPSRVQSVSRTGVGGAVSRGWHRPHRTVPHSSGDGFPLGSWCNRAGA
jgi:hypothetical protein